MRDKGSTPTPCAAGVTVYRPDETLLLRLLARLRDEGVPTLVHVDGPAGEAAGEALLAQLRVHPDITILQAERNGGIGRALNRLAGAAADGGFRRILFLDQDSDLPPGMPSTLSAAFDAIEAANIPCAAMGPRPVAPPDETTQPPRYRRRRTRGTCRSIAGVEFLITSGSLVSLDKWRAIGPFREDYFIDAIDVEWCFRARGQDYEILLDEAVAMPHRVGGGVVRFGPLAFPRQSDERMLTYVRNQAHMLRLRHVPLRWKLRTLLYVPLQVAARAFARSDGGGSIAGFTKAASDGFRGRFENEN